MCLTATAVSFYETMVFYPRMYIQMDCENEDRSLNTCLPYDRECFSHLPQIV